MNDMHDMNDLNDNTTSESEAGTAERPRKARRRMSLVAAGVITLAGLLAAPQLATAAPQPPDVPTKVQVPAGNVLSSLGRAQGFQIYTCQQQKSGYSWTLLQPMAVLLEEGHKPFALHFGGPTWMAIEDGSSVVATRVDSAPAPSGTAIPWLLLKATPKSGPADGVFSSTTYIQRINTTGGVAPASGCDADHVGASASVYYTADYYFYRAA